ncbi:hypothetical protein F5887DRAFT_969767 [Amanita rubescens]|nr:hypothetical protein F5887DRAFT_969767 [Amanita rubescens]
MQHIAPAIDIKNNPFFCPAVPAHNFLTSLSRNPKNFRSKEYKYRGRRFILRPFAAALGKCLFKGGGDSEDDKRASLSSEGEVNNTFGGLFGPHISTLNATGRGIAIVKSTRLRTDLRGNTGDSFGSDSYVTIPLAPTVEKMPYQLITIQRNRNLAPHTLTLQDKLSSEHSPPQDKPSPNLKRKSSESHFTYDSGTKRARSTLSIDDRFFLCHPPTRKATLCSHSSQRLQSRWRPSESPGLSSATVMWIIIHFEELRAGTRITVPRLKNWHGPVENIPDLDRPNMTELAGALQDELFGPRLGPETNSMLPGIRIKERLMERIKNGAGHQGIIDFFGENGHLNANVLELFRASRVTKISLSESFRDINGLNLVSDDSFFVFSKPNSFRYLTTLFLDRICLKTPTLSHLQHLPKLATLSLFDTGIDNDALRYLFPLKFTLMSLNIARNPEIDDEATSALLPMTRLIYLSIAETSIGMPGARELVNGWIKKGRRLSINFPHWCHEYVATMGSKYSLELPPPLIFEPLPLWSARNLAVHAAVNKEVSTGGTKKEMADRLKSLLEMRLADLEVRRLIENPVESVRRRMESKE